MLKFARILSLPLAALALAPAPALASPEVATEAAAIAPTGPALWMVADEDTTIYLFGTVHALPKEVVWLDGKIAEALDESGELVTEVKFEEGQEMAVAQLFNARGSLPQGQSLRAMLSDEQRASYEAAMVGLGLPVQAFDSYEPWYAGLTLSLLPLIKAGYSPDAGVEEVLKDYVGDKPQSGLETLDFQVNLFDGLPQESQIAFLMSVADNIDQVAPMLDAMVAEWVEGDPEGLAVLMNEDLEDRVLAERLLYLRNAQWAQWIDDRLDRPGTVFVAVGAGHLAGLESVQEKLNERGIETARVE